MAQGSKKLATKPSKKSKMAKLKKGAKFMKKGKNVAPAIRKKKKVMKRELYRQESQRLTKQLTKKIEENAMQRVVADHGGFTLLKNPSQKQATSNPKKKGAEGQKKKK